LKICHSEPRSLFERGEESAFSLVFLQKADPSPANDAGSGRQERNSMTTNPNLQHIGMIVEIAGVASAVAGVVLSLHHWPAAAALIGGGVAYVIGKTLRGE
jgi:hypothetical protein